MAADVDLMLGAARDELVCLVCHEHFRGTKLTTCPSCDGDGIVVTPAPEVAVTEIAFSEWD